MKAVWYMCLPFRGWTVHISCFCCHMLLY